MDRTIKTLLGRVPAYNALEVRAESAKFTDVSVLILVDCQRFGAGLDVLATSNKLKRGKTRRRRKRQDSVRHGRIKVRNFRGMGRK